MGAQPKRSKDAIAASLFALLEACPFYQDNPEDCPLAGVRKLPRAQRRAWLKNLGQEELSYLAAYHHVCLAIRNGVAASG